MEEIGSLVVILRLWRVIKVGMISPRPNQEGMLIHSLQIIEELSAGAEERMVLEQAPLHERLHTLEQENAELKLEMKELKKQQASYST